MAILIRLGEPADFAAAVSVFERSNSARRHGVWPHRPVSTARLRECLRKPAAWLLVAEETSALVGMASVDALYGDDGRGAGEVLPNGCFLSHLFVGPERWGEGIGGALLDAVLAEARRRHYSQLRHWTHEDNERSHRLYRSRGFSPTGRIADGEGEWAADF